MKKFLLLTLIIVNSAIAAQTPVKKAVKRVAANKVAKVEKRPARGTRVAMASMAAPIKLICVQPQAIPQQPIAKRK